MKLPDDVIEEVPWDPLKGPPPSIANTLKNNRPSGSSTEEAQALADFQTAAVAKAEEDRVASFQGRTSTATASEAREIKGICWMAKDFPMSLRELLPLLEAVGGANKHIAAAAGFIGAYRTQNLFPVRIKVPLMWTVYLKLRFEKYRELKPSAGEPALEDGSFFEVPRGYVKASLMGDKGDVAGEESVEETFYEVNE
jgi:hypothetical protein